MIVTDIRRHDSASNVGGISELFFILQKDFNLPTNIPPNVFRRNVSATISNNLFVLYHSPKTANFSENSQISKHGKFYEQTLKLKIPQNRIEVEATLQAIANNKLLVVYKDRNGKTKKIRNLTMTETSVINENENNTEILLKGISKEKSKFLGEVNGIDGFVCDVGSSGTVRFKSHVFDWTTQVSLKYSDYNSSKEEFLILQIVGFSGHVIREYEIYYSDSVAIINFAVPAKGTVIFNI